jgi:hypothetical protein
MATSSGLTGGGDAGAVIVSVATGEPVLRQAEREISILVARQDVTVTHARSLRVRAAGRPPPHPSPAHRRLLRPRRRARLRGRTRGRDGPAGAHCRRPSRALAHHPRTRPSRRLPRRQGSILAMVTNVLENAPAPTRVRDIHTTVEELLGEPVPCSSVKDALSAHSDRGDHRFRRTRRGCYELS